MPYLPDSETFHGLADEYPLVPVYRRLLSDSLTPVSAFHLLDHGGYASLFESVIGGEKVGRYTFVAMDPFLSLTARGQQVTVKSEQGEETLTLADPLVELRRRLAEFPTAHLPELPPFTGGAIGYCAYDVVRYVENLKHPPQDDRHLPDLCF